MKSGTFDLKKLISVSEKVFWEFKEMFSSGQLLLNSLSKQDKEVKMNVDVCCFGNEFRQFPKVNMSTKWWWNQPHEFFVAIYR